MIPELEIQMNDSQKFTSDYTQMNAIERFEHCQAPHIRQHTRNTLFRRPDVTELAFTCHQVPADLANDPEAREKIAKIVCKIVQQQVKEIGFEGRVKVHKTEADHPYQVPGRDSKTVAVACHFKRPKRKKFLGLF